MSVKISRILHAGYLFSHQDTQIIFDPIFENPFSGNCFASPAVKFDLAQVRRLKLSAIFISHYHDDHCSFASLDLLDRSTPIYIHCIYDQLFSLVHELGFTSVHKLVFDKAVKVGSFEIIPRAPFDPHIDSMLQVNVAGLKILNVVDSVLDPVTLPNLAQEAPWDMVLWPFQAMQETFVIAPSRSPSAGFDIPEDWIEDLRTLNPRFIVPSACQFLQEPWSWYNQALFPISYKKFKDVIETTLPNSKVVRMNPGSTWTLDKTAASANLVSESPLPFVIPVGPQDIDYDYHPQLSPPSTADIASKLKPLSRTEAERVDNYCREELLLRYQNLDPTPYFIQPKLWRLLVFDHLGVGSKFDYRICDRSIELIGSSSTEDCEAHAVTWLTEVPASKLFAAVERGETLTSMYVRINECKFSEKTELDLLEMNLLEDPLIRTLFDRRFGAYQREQLREIQSETELKS